MTSSFAGARAGQHEERSLGRGDGFALSRVQDCSRAESPVRGCVESGTVVAKEAVYNMGSDARTSPRFLAFARSASTSRSRGGAVVTRSHEPGRDLENVVDRAVESSGVGLDGAVTPLSLRTNAGTRPRISSSGPGLEIDRVLMFCTWPDRSAQACLNDWLGRRYSGWCPRRSFPSSAPNPACSSTTRAAASATAQASWRGTWRRVVRRAGGSGAWKPSADACTTATSTSRGSLPLPPCRAGLPTSLPRREQAKAISEPFRAWPDLYRDGRDSVAPHNDHLDVW